MTTVEAVFQDGVFKPTGPVALPDRQRVKLRVEPVPDVDALAWAERMKEFHRDWLARRGPLPDSTPAIREDRDRDD